MARKERKLCRDRDKKKSIVPLRVPGPCATTTADRAPPAEGGVNVGRKGGLDEEGSSSSGGSECTYVQGAAAGKGRKADYTSQLLTRRRVASQAATAPSHSFAVSFLAPAAISIIAVIRLFLTKKGSNCVVGVVAVVPGHCQHFRAPFAALFGALQPAWMDSTSSGFLST